MKPGRGRSAVQPPPRSPRRQRASRSSAPAGPTPSRTSEQTAPAPKRSVAGQHGPRRARGSGGLRRQSAACPQRACAVHAAVPGPQRPRRGTPPAGPTPSRASEQIAPAPKRSVAGQRGPRRARGSGGSRAPRRRIDHCMRGAVLAAVPGLHTAPGAAPAAQAQGPRPAGKERSAMPTPIGAETPHIHRERGAVLVAVPGLHTAPGAAPAVHGPEAQDSRLEAERGARTSSRRPQLPQPRAAQHHPAATRHRTQAQRHPEAAAAPSAPGRA